MNPSELLTTATKTHCSNITAPYALQEICEQLDSGEYSAEILLRHLLIWVEEAVNKSS